MFRNNIKNEEIIIYLYFKVCKKTQHGIAAVINKEEDKPEYHLNDTLNAGIIEKLIMNAKCEPNIRIRENCFYIDLMVKNNRCIGVMSDCWIRGYKKNI